MSQKDVEQYLLKQRMTMIFFSGETKPTSELEVKLLQARSRMVAALVGEQVEEEILRRKVVGRFGNCQI